MNRRGVGSVAAVVMVAALVSCAPSEPPESQPSLSPTSSETAMPTASPADTQAPASPSPSASSPSEPPSANPAPQRVVGVTAMTGGGSGEVLLRWTQNPEPDVVSYIVFRALSPGGSLTRIGTVTWQEVTEFEYVPFVDSEATVGYYRVRAVDSAGQEGPRSVEVCGAAYGHSC